ncbi:MAG: hypothetical protein NVS3B25_21260 [Hymenobacter sp.]
MTLTAVRRPPRLWPAAIRAVFRGDVALLARWHIAAPCGLNAAVADTYLADVNNF